MTSAAAVETAAAFLYLLCRKAHGIFVKKADKRNAPEKISGAFIIACFGITP